MPVVHPPVERTVYVRADAVPVRQQLDAYSALWSPKRAVEATVALCTAGSWTAIRLPEAVHPWQLHNLAHWMLDTPSLTGIGDEVVAVAASSEQRPGYRLVKDPEIPDAMCGWDERGNGITVAVPGNDIVAPEDVPVPRAFTLPGGFADWDDHVVRFEDPGSAMNPQNAPTFRSRRALRTRGSGSWT